MPPQTPPEVYNSGRVSMAARRLQGLPPFCVCAIPFALPACAPPACADPEADSPAEMCTTLTALLMTVSS